MAELGRSGYELIRRKHCAVCCGEGHVAFQCSTKKTLDKNAKMADVMCEWGNVKSIFMFNGYANRSRLYAKYYTTMVAEYRNQLRPRPPAT